MTKSLTQFSLSFLMLSSALVATAVQASTADEAKAIELLKTGDAPDAAATFTNSVVNKAKEVQDLHRQLRILKDPDLAMLDGKPVKAFDANAVKELEAKLEKAESSFSDTLKTAASHMRGGTLAQSEVQQAIHEVNSTAAREVALLQRRLKILQDPREIRREVDQANFRLHRMEKAGLAVSADDPAYKEMTFWVQVSHDESVGGPKDRAIKAVEAELAVAEKSAAEKVGNFAEFTRLAKADQETMQALAKTNGELNGLAVREISASELSILKKGGAEAKDLEKSLWARIGKNTKVVGGIFVAAGVAAVTLYEGYGFIQDYKQVNGKAKLLKPNDLSIKYVKPKKDETTVPESGAESLDNFAH